MVEIIEKEKIIVDEGNKYDNKIFEDIKHFDENGCEYWKARELQELLEYKEWRYFSSVIEKAQIACMKSGNEIKYHFGVYTKMIKIAKTFRNIIDYKLSRYACYLIVQNANPKIKTVALGQTYFAVQTRKLELSEEEYSSLSEDEKRLYKRRQTKDGNYSLNQTAKKAGVKNFDKFHNAGYKGLYNGETAADIAKRKGLRYREDILDNMGSVELAANLFRISQTEEKIKNDKVDNEMNACIVHNTVGKIVRNAIKEVGGIMPEDLPIPDRSLKDIEKNK